MQYVLAHAVNEFIVTQKTYVYSINAFCRFKIKIGCDKHQWWKKQLAKEGHFIKKWNCFTLKMKTHHINQTALRKLTDLINTKLCLLLISNSITRSISAYMTSIFYRKMEWCYIRIFFTVVIKMPPHWDMFANKRKISSILQYDFQFMIIQYNKI